MSEPFGLTRPCADCPFRTDIAFYLREGRRAQIADALRSDETFLCHKTTNGDRDEDGGGYTQTGSETHCAGALIVMAKGGELEANWKLRFAIGLGLLDPGALDMNAPVFDSLEEFIKGDPVVADGSLTE